MLAVKLFINVKCFQPVISSVQTPAIIKNRINHFMVV